MRKLFLLILDHRRLVLVFYLVALVLSAIASQKVYVNSDLTAYLPEDSNSTIALRIMEEAFGGDIPTLRLMVKEVSFEEATELKEKIREMPGVREVTFISTADYLALPYRSLPDNLKEQAYRDGSALYTITMDINSTLSDLDAIREMTGHPTAAAGMYADTKTTARNSTRELFITISIVVAFGIAILLLTLPSWLEPFLLVLALMCAVLLNAGTNLIFGSISMITNIASSVLQMGVSVDYSIFLLHRSREYRRQGLDAKEALAEAMVHSGSSILSSALTTAIGFMALTVMRYRIGLDIGLVLTKGIVISLLCAFSLFPCLLLFFDRLVQKTSHRVIFSDAPHITAISVKVRRPAMIIFLLLLVPAYLMQTRSNFYYGASHNYKDSHPVMQEKQEIEEVFGRSNQAVLLVPEDRLEQEKALEDRLLAEVPEISSILSWPSTMKNPVLQLFVPDRLKNLLLSGGYSRSVISLDLDEETAQTFRVIEKIEAMADEMIGEGWHMAGVSASTHDLKGVISGDSLRVNLIALGAIFLVLIATFRSLLIPLVLTLTIEGSIWINMAVPFLTGNYLHYIGWLIVSSVLLGSTVDYAILTASRYRELRRQGEDLQSALSGCIRLSSISILTSGLILIVAGVLLNLLCSNQIIAQVGFLLARGTFIAIVAVLFVLPGELGILDRFMRKNAPSVQSESEPGEAGTV